MKTLIKHRGKSGMTQKDLANKLGISRMRVIQLESDDCHQLSKTLENKLCEVFEVNKFELLGIDNLRHIPETKEEALYEIKLLEELMKKWD